MTPRPSNDGASPESRESAHYNQREARMHMPGRETEVLSAVVALVDSLLADFDVVDLLTQLTERSTQLLDVASAGLLLADGQRRLHLMAATSPSTHDLELFQLQSDQGPCLDCYETGEAISVPDLQAQAARWPRFAAAATAAGFASVHALPMRAAGMVLGTLGLFGTSTGELAPQDLLVGQTLAHVATVAIVQEHPPTADRVLPRLRGALASQVAVEQAKGFLRSRLGVSVDDALSLLRAYAHDNHLRLSDLARQLVSEPAARDRIMHGISQLSRVPQTPPGRA